MSRIVTLSVGGEIFQTNLDTLTRDTNSMLSAMFSGRHPIEKEERGYYFIDRDGKLFRYILNYLRKGELVIPPDDLILVEELRQEAQYFQLNEMLEYLDKLKMNATRTYISYRDLLQLVNAHKPIYAPWINMNYVTICYIDLQGAFLQGSDFSYAVFREVNLTSANLTKCLFVGATIQQSILHSAVLDGSDCRDSNFSGNDMRRSKCIDCNFSHARLSGADLRDSNMQGSNLSEANLLVANLEGCYLGFANLTHANIEGANIKGARGMANEIQLNRR
jgi:uncharacterized protein YjbI with pentapeptide repeats